MDQVQNTKFDSADGFQAWISQEGKAVEFPYGPKGWVVQIESGKPLAITSPFYDVISSAPYGAPKIVGHKFPFGDISASGVVELGFKDGVAVVMNRRRLTKDDAVKAGQIVINTIEVAPDRLDEPVACLVSEADKAKFAAMTADEWLDLMNTVRDGVEMMVVRAVRTWALS